MGVAGVRGLEGDRLRLRLHHHVVDGAELDVADVRPLVVAPAEVEPCRLGGDGRERVVERLHLGGGVGDEGLLALVRIHGVPAHGEIGAIELDHEARRVDRLVLGPHDGGQRLQIGVLARVVPVGLEQRDHARRGRVHEALDRACAFQRRAHVGDVLLQRGFVLDADLAGAHGALELGRLPLRRDALHVVGIEREVRRHAARAVAGEAVEAVLDIGGIADLAHLAVGDHVHPGVDLLAHHVRDGAFHAGVERAPVGERAVLLGEQHLGDIRRPRQAADMRGENALGAELHAVLRPSPGEGGCPYADRQDYTQKRRRPHA